LTVLFKLKNQVKHYNWGSPQWIPQLLGVENPDASPYAELWMGVHPDGPSETEYRGERISLAQLVAEKPLFYLGEPAAQTFGTLPFLFKVLAADKPLSIQAHPSREQALAGFERENRAGLPLDAPNRNYKDPNHKPEIICALTPFKAMVGFRESAEIKTLFAAFGLPALDTVQNALDVTLQAFLEALFTLEPQTRKQISEYAQSQKQALTEKFPAFAEIWDTAAAFAGLYDGDPAVLAPLYLNIVHLAPGEALSLPSGVLHAYIHGLGVELMANSDNVLRGGLTVKHIDIAELLHILTFSPFKPTILKPRNSTYPSPCKEFALSVWENETVSLPEKPSIVIVTRGEALLSEKDGETILKSGESAFVPAGTSEIVVSGTYTLYSASLGAPRHPQTLAPLWLLPRVSLLMATAPGACLT
jgi:mannose-6-phosphate isomerase